MDTINRKRPISLSLNNSNLSSAFLRPFACWNFCIVGTGWVETLSASNKYWLPSDPIKKWLRIYSLVEGISDDAVEDEEEDVVDEVGTVEPPMGSE